MQCITISFCPVNSSRWQWSKLFDNHRSTHVLCVNTSFDQVCISKHGENTILNVDRKLENFWFVKQWNEMFSKKCSTNSSKLNFFQLDCGLKLREIRNCPIGMIPLLILLWIIKHTSLAEKTTKNARHKPMIKIKEGPSCIGEK